MKIVITGGAGFVGSSLSISLKKKYPMYEILAFDNLRRRGSELSLRRFNDCGVLFEHGDIRNPEDFEILDGCDVLIDASADPSVLSGIDSPVMPVISSNLMGTVNALEYAAKHQAKFIFMSTSRIYPVARLESARFVELETRFQWNDDQDILGISSRGVTEDFPLSGSRSFYGASKLASELLIEEYQEHKGLSTIVNRFGVISGPWQMGKVDQGVLVLWLARHFFRKKLSYIGYGGQGKQTRDVLHIDDVIDLIDYQIHHFDVFEGIAHNVGGGLGVSFSLQELTGICAEVTGNQIEIESVMKNRPADLRIYISDNSKLQALCGWTPQRSLLGLVTDTFEWLKYHEQDLKKILG
ncbi:MAG TPA: 3-beta hydroxysteroid dehydrogenase [Flavobacteriales bacterium]|nr:NAD-dependent epimerase/dehydratase family protein [Flavobacteriales bacterium]HAW21283.1 3-beta hydroxysteroid dehydrogenase [Flavobacteriales bacterium]